MSLPEIRAVTYARVSHKKQLRNNSLAAQERACVDFCRREGLTVDRVFIERGESAKTANRTELKRLIEYCRKNKGRISVVLVDSLDRFSRNVGEHHR